MKTIEQIKNSKAVYIGEWAKSKRQGVLNDFEYGYGDQNLDNEREAISKHKGERILFAAYVYEWYDGYAFVLFEKGGKLYEVNGGHCSCYGLEDQWEPERVVIKELRNRVKSSSYMFDGYKDELSKFLGL